MSVSVAVNMLPPNVRRVVDFIVEILMAVMAVYMIIYGFKLCEATWQNSIAEFPWLSVGIVYSPIPIGGLFTLLFIIEHVTIGRPAMAGGDPHLPVE
jgi:TRAP-type C4-dicarboxylate transport system permease small subunit